MKGILNDKVKLSKGKYGAAKVFLDNMESSKILCVDYVYI